MMKQAYSFSQRQQDAAKVLERYPTRVPVIIESTDASIPRLQKRKYLVPRTLKVVDLLNIVRKQLVLKNSEAIFLLCNGSTLPSALSITDLYDQNHEPDGFVYIDYRMENAFG